MYPFSLLVTEVCTFLLLWYVIHDHNLLLESSMYITNVSLNI